MARLALIDVAKRYGSIGVIHGVSLTIEHGEFVVFVGPSGCGKSTLLRMIAGLEPITAGQLLIDEEVVNEVPPARRGVAMVFQSYALYPHMSAYRNMAFGLETIGIPKDQIKERVHKAARALRIEELLARKPRQLSGGQRQRVAIGRAIVREPRLFLFDEPLSNLDADLRVQMRVELTKLHQSLGATMVYVTHDQVEAMTMANKIVVLNAGKIEQVGSPLDLYNFPSNRFVAGFIGSPRMNFIEISVTGRSDNSITVKSAGGSAIDLPISGSQVSENDKFSLGVRPEHLVLGNNDFMAKACIGLTEQLGDKTLVYATLPDGQSVVVQVAGQNYLKVGQVMDLSIQSNNCHLFSLKDGRAIAKR